MTTILQHQPVVLTQAAGMFQKKPGGRAKPEIVAVKGPAPGLVIVRARAVRGAAYEWQMSTDGRVTWVAVALTTVASTSVSGLARRTDCLFRFRTTRRDVTGTWSQAAPYVY
jgi:hypothetical protein